MSLRRVADSRMGSVYLRLFSFLQSFWLAHMNTHPMTYSRDRGLRIPDLLIFHTLVISSVSRGQMMVSHVTFLFSCYFVQ